MERANECLATYQGILDLSETQVGEINNGRLATHPRLAGKALFTKAQLGGVLGWCFGQRPFDQVMTVDGKPE